MVTLFVYQNVMVISVSGYEDVYDTGFCHYYFPSDKIVVTTEVHLIGMYSFSLLIYDFLFVF